MREYWNCMRVVLRVPLPFRFGTLLSPCRSRSPAPNARQRPPHPASTGPNSGAREAVPLKIAVEKEEGQKAAPAVGSFRAPLAAFQATRKTRCLSASPPSSSPSSHEPASTPLAGWQRGLKLPRPLAYHRYHILLPFPLLRQGLPPVEPRRLRSGSSLGPYGIVGQGCLHQSLTISTHCCSAGKRRSDAQRTGSVGTTKTAEAVGAANSTTTTTRTRAMASQKTQKTVPRTHHTRLIARPLPPTSVTPPEVCAATASGCASMA